jgi:hypothetical protein
LGIAGSRVKRSGGGAYDPEDAPLQQFRWPEREKERERGREGGREGGEGESMRVGVCECLEGVCFVCIV